MSTIADLIARLEAAVSPPSAGDAALPEQREAATVLARLVAADAAYGAVTTTSASDNFSVRHASWEAARASTLADLDRSARALMVLLRAVAPRYPETSPDPRGNVIPPELLGEPIDPAVRAMDPGSPLPDVPEGTSASLLVSCIARHTVSLRTPFEADSGVDDTAVEAATDVARAYDRAHAAAEPQPRTTSAHDSNARVFAMIELRAARKAAQDFVDYLDASLVTE